MVRTPEERFADLDNYPFKPNYFEHEGYRLHYLDEGPKDAKEVIYLIHGMPMWSYCYRHMIPPLVAKGHRVVALDFLGMGKSDKPVDGTKFARPSRRHHVATRVLLSISARSWAVGRAVKPCPGPRLSTHCGTY